MVIFCLDFKVWMSCAAAVPLRIHGASRWAAQLSGLGISEEVWRKSLFVEAVDSSSVGSAGLMNSETLETSSCVLFGEGGCQLAASHGAGTNRSTLGNTLGVKCSENSPQKLAGSNSHRWNGWETSHISSIFLRGCIYRNMFFEHPWSESLVCTCQLSTVPHGDDVFLYCSLQERKHAYSN